MNLDTQPDSADPVSDVDEAFRPRRDIRSDSLIYHYCNPDTSLQISKNKSVRFGDALNMNDGEEVTWGIKQFEIAVQRLRDRNDVEEVVPPTPKAFFDEFVPYFHRGVKTIRQMIACFSSEGDSLSQWRAYAADGSGLSIGYEQKRVEVPAQLLKVCYNERKQQAYLIAALSTACSAWKSQDGQAKQKTFHNAVMTAANCIAFKNPAFAEEREISLSYIALLRRDGGSLPSLHSEGGKVFDKEVNSGPIDFRVSNGKIVSFADFPITLDESSVVREVWLGPRCQSTVLDVEILLGTLGYQGIDIKLAGSKYR